MMRCDLSRRLLEGYGYSECRPSDLKFRCEGGVVKVCSSRSLCTDIYLRLHAANRHLGVKVYSVV